MINIALLKEQNPWWIAKEKIKDDVNLEKLRRVKYKWHPKVIDSFNLKKDAIYTLRGSRQIGKTTLLKLLIAQLLKDNNKENICYFTCNAIDSFKELIEILQIYFNWTNNNNRKFIFIDEVTFVKGWTKAIKHLADLGRLRGCFIILTGSNSHDLKYEVERMPGRRGEDPELDKILFPLSFREYVNLTAPDIIAKTRGIKLLKKNYSFYKKELRKYLNDFLLTGGFIQAINSFAGQDKVDVDIYNQYLSWILGDLARLGKNELYSRQIFEQIINCVTTNLGYDTIAKKTTIDSHLTVKDYLDVMESNFIIKILYQIDMNKRLMAHRKTKKIYFQDLFLLWVFMGYVYGLSDYFSYSSNKLYDSIFKAKLIENLVISQLIKLENSINWSNVVFFFRTQNQNEVDFVIKGPKAKLLPIETKYKRKVGLKDFLSLDKINRSKGIIISRDNFIIKGGKWILPPEAFLILDLDFLKPYGA